MLDPLANITIWTIYEGMAESEDEPAYDGCVMDVPWYLTDYTIYVNSHEDIAIRPWENKIILTIKEPEEE